MSFVTHQQTSNPQHEAITTSSSHSSNAPSTQPPHLVTPSASAPIAELNDGPWLNYAYPSKWEISDDFMCVHFIPKTADAATWKSQCLFWNEAISLYAQQLLYQCPYKCNRLTFTSLDIQRAYTRKNSLKPMCIIDIIQWMKVKRNNILFLSFLQQNYQNNSQHNTQNINEPTHTNASLLSISSMTSMVSSMFEYLLPTAVANSSEDEYDCDDVCDSMNAFINDNTALICTPVMDELCDRMSDLNFYQKTCSHNSDLRELVSIGTIAMQKGEFVINGLVFYRFCVDILNLTVSDVLTLKKYLIFAGKVKLFYLNEEDSMHFTAGVRMKNNIVCTNEILYDNINHSNFHDLKNEMIFFCCNIKDFELQITSQEILNKMQLLSISLTMKHLVFQKTENENNLNQLTEKILSKFKKVSGAKKRKEFLHENVLLFEKKKLLKKRISCIDGSIYNLETTLHSMQDLNLNKMVFAEMKNADKILKDILKTTPSITQITEMCEDMKESIGINEEIGDVLSKPMDTDDNDMEMENEELLKEYEDLEMENIKNELPEAPNHDVMIKDNVDGAEDVLVENEKQVLMH